MAELATRAALARVPIGARRRRFVLERVVEEPDGFGGTLRRFVPGPVLSGALSPLGERARLLGGRGDAISSANSKN